MPLEPRGQAIAIWLESTGDGRTRGSMERRQPSCGAPFRASTVMVVSPGSRLHPSLDIGWHPDVGHASISLSARNVIPFSAFAIGPAEVTSAPLYSLVRLLIEAALDNGFDHDI
jgi:hypothetical protein